ncbi:MAG: hypothetical protein E7014_04215 [Alphaproteobacteria bacterium]|nr:hypothetical protein [Alphaproteobacteria bacterium]
MKHKLRPYQSYHNGVVVLSCPDCEQHLVILVVVVVAKNHRQTIMNQTSYL